MENGVKAARTMLAKMTILGGGGRASIKSFLVTITNFLYSSFSYFPLGRRDVFFGAIQIKHDTFLALV